MSSIYKFEDLEVWLHARSICQSIRELTTKGDFAKDFGLKDQIQRSSGSVMDNIAEGYDRDGTREFIQFLYIAKGSLAETRSQLHRSFDFGYINEQQFSELYQQCNLLSTKIKNFISYLSTSGIAGSKKKPKPQ